MNANLIFKWLRDPRYAPDPALVASSSEESRFLPVEIVAEAKAPVAVPAADNHIEIELAGGHPMDLHRFCSGQVLMLGGPLFEGHG